MSEWRRRRSLCMQHDKPFTEAKKIFLKTFVLLHGNSEARIPPSMASHKELLVEWTMLDGDYNNWTMQGKREFPHFKIFFMVTWHIYHVYPINLHWASSSFQNWKRNSSVIVDVYLPFAQNLVSFHKELRNSCVTLSSLFTVYSVDFVC